MDGEGVGSCDETKLEVPGNGPSQRASVSKVFYSDDLMKW